MLMLLWVAGFSLATKLEPWSRNRVQGRRENADVLTLLLGDSRRLFARHVYAKADAYFHSGYYPSFFQEQPGRNNLHLTSHWAGDYDDGHAVEAAVFGQPKDWMDRFRRHFCPSDHRHLGEADQAPGTGAVAQTQPLGRGTERELLPWLQWAAELDPARPETFIVAAYWLRSHLSRVDEAEQFIRQGLRSNPGHPELLFELGRIFLEHRQDPGRARNVWEEAWAQWQQREETERASNRLLSVQLLANLAQLEEKQGRPDQALTYLRGLLEVTPSRGRVQEWIEHLTTAQGRGSSPR